MNKSFGITKWGSECLLRRQGGVLPGFINKVRRKGKSLLTYFQYPEWVPVEEEVGATHFI